MELENSLGLAELKKHKRKLHRIIKKNIEDNKDDGSKRTMFEVDFQILKEGLDPDLLSQITELVADTKDNFQNYKTHMAYQKHCEQEGPTSAELVFRPRRLTESEAHNYGSLGGMDIEGAAVDALKTDCIMWERKPIDQGKELEYLKELYKLPYLNHTTVVKRLRMVPLMCLILQSPYLRGELDYMFDKWIESFENLVKSKFCTQKTAEEPPKDQTISNSILEDDDTIEFKRPSVDSDEDEESIMKMMGNRNFDDTEEEVPESFQLLEVSEADDLYQRIKHSHKIRFGGILKQMLAMWTCEEVYNSCITVFYWLSGFLQLKENKDKSQWMYQCKKIEKDIEPTTEEEFLEACNEVSDRALISPELTKSIAKMILRWVGKMNDLEKRLADPQLFKMDQGKIKSEGVSQLLKFKLTQRDLFDRFSKHPLLKEILEVTEKGSGINCKLSKEEIAQIVTAENSFFVDNIKFRKTQFYCGKESYLPISAAHDLTTDDIEYWLLSNLMSPEYLPLVSVSHHFANSVVDLTANALLRRRDEALPAQVYKDSMKQAQLLEVRVEVETFLGLINQRNPSEFTKLITFLDNNQLENFTKNAMKQAFSLWKELKGDKNLASIDPVYLASSYKPIVDRFVGLVDRFLDNKLEKEETEIMADFLLSEMWTRFTQRIDSSHLLESSLIPLVQSTMDKLEKMKTNQCSNPLVKNRLVYEGTNSEEVQVLITLGKPAYCSRILCSSDIADFYVRLCENILQLQPSVIIKANASKSADDLYNKTKKEFEKLNANKMNEKPPEEARYSKNPKKGHFQLHETTNKAMKKVRRLIPEFRCEGSDSTIPKRIWEKLEEFTVDCHWKVHQGLVTWFALMVDGSDYEEEVIKVLKKADFGRVRSRDAAIKIMGLIADHFKIHTDADYPTKNKELLKIPYWVFSGADTIFGFTAENELDCKTWKEDFLNNVIDWVGYFPPETFGGVNLNYDFETAMEHFLRDFKTTYSPYNLEFLEFSETILNRPSDLKGKIENLQLGKKLPRESSYYSRKDEEGFFVFNDFFTWCKSFLKFSVDGSAQGLKIDVDKLYIPDQDVPTTNDITEEQIKDLNEAQTDTNFGRKLPKNEEIDVPPNESPEDSAEPKESKAEVAIQKAIDNKVKEAGVLEKKNAKTKSLTKTLAFALGGKNLARMLFWTGGDNYVPELTIHLKIEKKKIRLVANSDVVSFNKQNYVYDWIHRAFADTSRELVYTFIHPRDKVKRVERFSECFRGEKWQCPMDLKDFQNQFGPTHHRTFMRCLWRRVSSVTYDPIKKELQYLISSLHEELCKGLIYFRKKTAEDFHPAKDKLKPEKQKYIRSFVSELPKEKDPDDFDNDEGEMPEVDLEDMIEEEKTKKKDYNVFIAFEIKNGLLSGWKMTSMMGSIYNYSTNNMINFWSLLFFGLVPTDYATQGDDTHFKTRFLMSSLFHTAFVNTIGKQAHPQKQFFSTRYTEFLKKTYDMWTKDIRYQPCRIIGSLLFENEERENKANNKNSLKDFVDMWNMFLVRIPGGCRTHQIAEVLKLPSRAIQVKYGWHSKKGAGGFYELSLIDKLFSVPEMVGSFLSGPLTKKELLCKFDEDSKSFKPI
jgi:hypothetical protein